MNCRNGEEYLQESIDSILKQSYKNWELIFVDNASSDKSKILFNEYNDERLKYVFITESVNLGSARQIALENCNGEYISFLDTDDLWLPTKLEKQNFIRREGQKIILAKSALSLQKPENSIKTLSIFFEKLSILLSAQDWFGPATKREDIELYFKKYYTVFWNHYFKMQIPFLTRWKNIFGDLETWMIWANMGINQSKNLEKISKNLNTEIQFSKNNEESFYLNKVQDNQPKHGVNASSIAEISGIPRATVLRKLKKLLSEKIIKRNKKLEYFLSDEGKLDEKIKTNFIINQKEIVLFVTNIFNLIKKSPFKI